MDKLPLLRVTEVAFLTTKVRECAEFYRKIGLTDLPSDLQRLNFADVGEQLFGFCDERIGFIDGYGGYTKARIYVAFEVPDSTLDGCVDFLSARGISTSPKNEFVNWHGAARSTSIYFTDPGGNIIELWAPKISSAHSQA
jgi:catechol-2,3-dioxygenase